MLFRSSLERGAVLYFTNSNFGRCNNNICTRSELNAYYDDTGGPDGEYYFTTGCGPLTSGSIETSDSTCNAYNTTLGKLASTTSNVFGIYDLNGGADEVVMGNMSSTTGSYTYSSCDSDYIYSGNEKYVDIYATNIDNGAKYPSFNGTRLGDAIGEPLLSFNGYREPIVWYDEESGYLYSGSAEDLCWLEANSFYTRWGSQYFGYEQTTSRAVLVSLQ